MLLKKRQRETAEIPAASLADIAFLLLIFFLVTTTMDVDTGIGLVLPPKPDESVKPPPIKERNLLKILVNQQGLVLINDRPAGVAEVRQKVMDFVDNVNRTRDENMSEAPDKAVVSLKTDRATPYSLYIAMLDEVRGAYNELWDAVSMRQYGIRYIMLDNERKAEIRKIYPQNISEAEPDAGTGSP
jgi:biopolymer transport protein ExbD